MQCGKRTEVFLQGTELDMEISHVDNYRRRERDREIPVINVNRQENYMEREQMDGCAETTKDNYGERRGASDLLDVDLYDKDDHQKSESCSRFSGLLTRTNGNISRPLSCISKRSINCSIERLSEPQGDSISENPNGSIVCKSMYSLGLLSLASLALCIIAVQIVLSISSIPNGFIASSESLLNSSQAYNDIVEVAVALSTFVIVLDLSCVLVSSMQCIFMLQILQLADGEDRALKYLKECSSSRYVVVFGFFLSLPTLLIALTLYMVMRFRSTTAIIATVILLVGILFSALSILQNACQWQIEKNRADAGLPVYGISEIKTFEPEVPRNELSTLV